MEGGGRISLSRRQRMGLEIWTVEANSYHFQKLCRTVLITIIGIWCANVAECCTTLSLLILTDKMMLNAWRRT